MRVQNKRGLDNVHFYLKLLLPRKSISFFYCKQVGMRKEKLNLKLLSHPKLKLQIKDICSILIKSLLKEGHNE